MQLHLTLPFILLSLVISPSAYAAPAPTPLEIEVEHRQVDDLPLSTVIGVLDDVDARRLGKRQNLGEITGIVEDLAGNSLRLKKRQSGDIDAPVSAPLEIEVERRQLGDLSIVTGVLGDIGLRHLGKRQGDLLGDLPVVDDLGLLDLKKRQSDDIDAPVSAPLDITVKRRQLTGEVEEEVTSIVGDARRRFKVRQISDEVAEFPNDVITLKKRQLTVDASPSVLGGTGTDTIPVALPLEK